MVKFSKKIKTRISKFISKHKRDSKNLPPVFVFMIAAAMAALGYTAGTFNYQIEAAIGPVFGYQPHAGQLDLSSVQKTYNQLAAYYDGNLDTNALIEGASRGLVAAAGDDYTIYMNSKETAEFNNSLSGNIGGGVGAVIGLKDGQITIMKVLKNNPAIKAGLQIGDAVLKVNDQATTGWTVDKAVGLIRGEAGTTVKITVSRGSEIKEFIVTRAIISNPSVESSVENGIGTITISRFDNETGSLASAAAQDFKKQNVKSVILDLRGNGGGYVQAAKEVASLWLNDKVIVTERNGATIRETVKSGTDPILAGIPTVVLIDGASASASEIVAGALQDYKVAKLVGEKSFGKGSVQQLITLDNNSQLKVTIARWYTPNGKNINKEGIAPDTVVSLTQSDADKGLDPQVDAAKKILNN